MRRRGAQRAGAALVLALIVLLVIGLLAVALGFTVTLDSLAARNARDAALAEGQAEGALELAAASLLADPARAGNEEIGPWPELGIAATVRVTQQPDAAWRLASRAAVGRSLSVRTVVLRIAADGTFQVAARP